MVHLSIHTSEDLILTNGQAKQFTGFVTSKIEVIKTEIETVPFKALFELECVPYNEQDVLESVALAFKEIDIDTGLFSIALTEHEEKDVELETPPYFEEEIDLANFNRRLNYVTINIEFYKSGPNRTTNTEIMKLVFSDTHIETLGKELALISENSILYYGEVLNTNKNQLRLVYNPQPADNIPEKNLLKEKIVDALQKSTIVCEKFEVGAYIKNRDNTLWQEEVIM